jgi:CheY-like chemotaxis protein
MMGGNIWVESDLGKGATFIFTVQLKRGASQEYGLASSDAATKQADETAGEDLADYTGKHMLLAEDVEINREIVLSLLEPTHIQADCAENGARAVRMFEEAPEKYDIIFMDVQMPEMDGYDATRHIRALDVPKAQTIPIIAMTANVFREDIQRCLEAGMNDHVGKPLDIDVVFDVMKKYLRP